MSSFRSTLYAAFAVFVLAACLALPGAAAERFDFPPVGEYQVLRCDFHMHTVISDGRLTARERVEESRRLGYDVIAITDHGQMLAYRSAKLVGNQTGVLVLRGLESGVQGKEHYVILGVDGTYRPRDSHRWSETEGGQTVYYREQMERVKAHGGLIMWAHPHVGLREPSVWGMEQGVIQGIELKNDGVGDGWNSTKSHGTSWYPNAFEWASKYNLAVFACTDAHGNRQANPGVSLLLATERTEKGVMEAIRERRTAAWFDGMLWGRKDVLGQLVGAMVRADFSGGELKLKNLGPVALKGAVEGPTGRTFELGPYQEATVQAGSEKATVRWENVWTGLEENLTSSYGK